MVPNENLVLIVGCLSNRTERGNGKSLDKFIVIPSGVNMPGADGLERLYVIKERHPELPVRW